VGDDIIDDSTTQLNLIRKILKTGDAPILHYNVLQIEHVKTLEPICL
jgi:hypothetical protein